MHVYLWTFQRLFFNRRVLLWQLERGGPKPTTGWWANGARMQGRSILLHSSMTGYVHIFYLNNLIFSIINGILILIFASHCRCAWDLHKLLVAFLPVLGSSSGDCGWPPFGSGKWQNFGYNFIRRVIMSLFPVARRKYDSTVFNYLYLISKI